MCEGAKSRGIITRMSCGHSDQSTETEAQRRVLRIALMLNATMFIVGLVAGVLGQSSSLIADALDMLADASAYAIALGAIGRSTRFKAGAATLSGSLLLLLGVLVLLDVGRRALFGSEPESLVMMAVAFLSLLVNATVLRMLGQYREGEVHLRATWIFTRVDVIANIGVILSGLLRGGAPARGRLPQRQLCRRKRAFRQRERNTESPPRPRRAAAVT
jgi:Co/Zn/Cd efflux system component